MKICSERVSNSEQAFEILHKAALKVKAEIDEKSAKKDMENLQTVKDKNLILEKYIIFLKKLLKEADNSRFDTIKKEVFV
jgi:hypothetical protein